MLAICGWLYMLRDWKQDFCDTGAGLVSVLPIWGDGRAPWLKLIDVCEGRVLHLLASTYKLRPGIKLT